MSGIDLVTLAAMLGHSRNQMVLRYAHPTQQHQTQAMQRLERLVCEQRIAQAEQESKNRFTGNPVKWKTAEKWALATVFATCVLIAVS